MSLIKISEKFVLNKLKSISQGNLKLINYDGKVFHFGDLESKLSSDIKINNPSFYLSVVLGGSSALGEAHMKKDFYTSNLTNLIELTARNINTIYSFSGSLKLQKIKNFLKRIFAANTKSKSIKYISKHYDLGNEFFSLWLDSTLTYSSAVYKNKSDDLDQAQKNKEDIIEIRGELRLINQKLDTLVSNHIFHLNRDVSVLIKIVVTVSTILFSGVITLLIKAFFI